jgi:hypothetical protein
MAYISRRQLEFLGEPIGNMSGVGVDGRAIYHGGGKGDSPPAPDYTPMANASEESARIGAELGREQLAENKRQFEVNQTTLKPVIDQSIETQRISNEQGVKNYETFQAEGRPIQQRLASIALGGDYTDAQKAKQEEAAGTAISDARAGTSQQMNQLIRQGLRMGWSPAKLASMGGQAATMGAQSQVSAANLARTGVQGKQLAQMGDAYNTYSGLGSSAPTFYNSGTGAAQAASGTQLGVSGQYMGGMAQGNGTIMQGQQARISGLGSILSSQTGIYDSQMAANSSSASGTMGLIGAGIGAAATIY